MKLAAITAVAAGTLAIVVAVASAPNDQWVVDWTEASGNRAAGQLQHLAHCVSASDHTLWRDIEISADEDHSGRFLKGSTCPAVDRDHKLLGTGKTS